MDFNPANISWGILLSLSLWQWGGNQHIKSHTTKDGGSNLCLSDFASLKIWSV